MNDPIVEQVRRVRKKIEADHGDDWDSLARYLIEKQTSSAAKTVSYQRRRRPDRGVD
jgi:hypothetical protein